MKFQAITFVVSSILVAFVAASPIPDATTSVATTTITGCHCPTALHVVCFYKCPLEPVTDTDTSTTTTSTSTATLDYRDEPYGATPTATVTATSTSSASPTSTFHCGCTNDCKIKCPKGDCLCPEFCDPKYLCV